MDESHDDQNFKCKIKKTWSKTCVFCCKKYPIPISIVILFFLLYLLFPLVYKIVIYSSPLVGFSLLVHRVLSAKNRQKSKQAEDDDRRKKYARSRRSFKSVYSDRSRLIRQNTPKKCDKSVDEKDNIFSKSLHELLAEKKSKDKVRFKSIPDECSSSNGKVKNVHPQVVDNDGVENDDKPKDHKVVQWTDDDQKNGMDLGLAEADRNKRLQSLMVRRRSRKNLGFEESGSTGYNDDNVKIPAIKTTKINPFLECKSGDKKSPGSAPSSMIKRSNPFDIPYDPHEEKLDLTGDNFHKEFTLVQPKEPVFCRHQSFNLGALSPSFTAHDKHDIPYYKDLSDKQKSAMGFVTSTVADNEGDNKHIQQDGTISDDSINSNHTKEEDAAEIKRQEIDSYNERKADINFFYGSNKRVHHAVSYSMVSDMQVELSEEDAVPTLDDLDIEKDRESFLNSSNAQTDSEMNGNSKVLNPDTTQGNHIQEPHGADQSFMAQAAPDGLTELAVGQASVGPSSPKSVLQREFSTDPASPYNFINEVQHLDNHIRQSESSDNALHQSNNDSGEHPFRDRDIDNLQDQN